jgi:hypothetical protein
VTSGAALGLTSVISGAETSSSSTTTSVTTFSA